MILHSISTISISISVSLARASISLSSSLGPLRHCQTRLSELRGVLVRRDDIEPLRGVDLWLEASSPIAYIFFATQPL